MKLFSINEFKKSLNESVEHNKFNPNDISKLEFVKDGYTYDHDPDDKGLKKSTMLWSQDETDYEEITSGQHQIGSQIWAKKSKEGENDKSFPDYKEKSMEMAKFHYNMYVKKHNKINESTDNVITIDVDVTIDPDQETEALAAFKEYGINYEETGTTTSNLTGSKENLIDYLTSEYYGWDIDEVQDVWPELFESVNESEAPSKEGIKT